MANSFTGHGDSPPPGFDEAAHDKRHGLGTPIASIPLVAYIEPVVGLVVPDLAPHARRWFASLLPPVNIDPKVVAQLATAKDGAKKIAGYVRSQCLEPHRSGRRREATAIVKTARDWKARYERQMDEAVEAQDRVPRNDRVVKSRRREGGRRDRSKPALAAFAGVALLVVGFVLADLFTGTSQALRLPEFQGHGLMGGLAAFCVALPACCGLLIGLKVAPLLLSPKGKKAFDRAAVAGTFLSTATAAGLFALAVGPASQPVSILDAGSEPPWSPPWSAVAFASLAAMGFAGYSLTLIAEKLLGQSHAAVPVRNAEHERATYDVANLGIAIDRVTELEQAMLGQLESLRAEQDQLVREALASAEERRRSLAAARAAAEAA